MIENWTDICPNFTKELVEDWKAFGFSHEQVEEWVKIRGCFSIYDAEFAAFIGDKELIIDDLKYHELVNLREEYIKEVEKNDEIEKNNLESKSEKITNSNDRNWKNIHPNFTPELVQEWQNYGFNYEEIQDWINIGIGITEARFSAWLRSEVKVDSEWVLNHGNFEQLWDEYQQYLTFTQIVQMTK